MEITAIDASPNGSVDARPKKRFTITRQLRSRTLTPSDSRIENPYIINIAAEKPIEPVASLSDDAALNDIILNNQAAVSKSNGHIIVNQKEHSKFTITRISRASEMPSSISLSVLPEVKDSPISEEKDDFDPLIDIFLI